MPGTIMGTALVQRAIPWATGMLAGAIIAGLAIWSLKPAPVPEERPVSRAVVPLLPGQQLAGLEQPAVAVSPDGTQLAYVASDNSSVPRLYLRAIDALEGRPLAGTEGASGPFFLPDGQWIGFSAEQALKKVAVSGGATLGRRSSQAERRFFSLSPTPATRKAGRSRYSDSTQAIAKYWSEAALTRGTFRRVTWLASTQLCATAAK